MRQSWLPASDDWRRTGLIALQAARVPGDNTPGAFSGMDRRTGRMAPLPAGHSPAIRTVDPAPPAAVPGCQPTVPGPSCGHPAGATFHQQRDHYEGDIDPMIRLHGIEKHFDTKAGRMYVLRRIDLDIREGEFVTIMGPSGAGKSTLLGILGLLDAEWSGEYWFGDEAVHRMNLRQRADLNKRNIGFVFQQYHLLDNLTVYENLEIPLSYRNVPRGERQAIVADVLDRFQIVGKKDLFPNQLSGGQQQLVAVARAVVASPRLILADEPTGNLHSAQAREIMELFRKLNDEGTTIVQVTHSEQNAAYGHRVIELLDGWIAGTTEVQSGSVVQG